MTKIILVHPKFEFWCFQIVLWPILGFLILPPLKLSYLIAFAYFFCVSPSPLLEIAFSTAIALPSIANFAVPRTSIDRFSFSFCNIHLKATSIANFGKETMNWCKNEVEYQYEKWSKEIKSDNYCYRISCYSNIYIVQYCYCNMSKINTWLAS